MGIENMGWSVSDWICAVWLIFGFAFWTYLSCVFFFKAMSRIANYLFGLAWIYGWCN